MTVPDYIRSYRHLLRIARFRGRDAALVLALTALTIAFESFGVASLLPIFELMGSGGDAGATADRSLFMQAFARGLALAGLPLTLPVLLLLACASVVARQICKYAHTVATARIQYRLVRNLSTEGMRLALAADLKVHDASRTGDLVSDLTTQANAATSAVFQLLQIAGSLTLVLTYIALLALLQPTLTILVLAVLALLALVLRPLMRRSRAAGETIVRTNRDFSSFLVERLHAVRLVRLSATEGVELTRIARMADTLRDTIVLVLTLRARIPLIVEPLAVIFALSFLYVSVTVFGLRFEAVIVFVAMLMRLTPLVQETANAVQNVAAGTAGVAILARRFMELDSSREADGGTKVLTGLRDGIALRNVSFSYGRGDDVPALTDVSLTIPARRITAIVGPSGAGKSTLTDLLLRLRVPQAGQMTLDGVAIDAFSTASLRQNIAYVPQSPQLFNSTVGEHIRYGRADATAAEVEAAARLADAAEFIARLPHGYDTQIGESGGLLSGGQRQRLDLARALLRRSPILILDEPASSLDADSEERLRLALRRIRDEISATIVLIAHGFSTVVDADQIVVLERGRVTSVGAHDVLLRQNGWYAGAFAKQFRPAARAVAAAGG